MRISAFLSNSMIVLICCVVSTHLWAQKNHQLSFKSKKSRQLIKLERQLRQLPKTKEKWEKQKALIKKAIKTQGIHPDSIKLADCFTWPNPLFKCVFLDRGPQDVAFARFLLTRGANATALRRSGDSESPLIFFAKTTQMAKVLIQHGAEGNVHSWGTELLSSVWSAEKAPALIPLYVANGAKVNQLDSKGTLPMNNLVVFFNPSCVEKAECFMQAGALLDIKSRKDRAYYDKAYTVPQSLKEELESFADAKKANEDLLRMRAVIITEQNARNKALCRRIIPWLLPELRDLVASFGAPERSYEELEDEDLTFIPNKSPELYRRAAITIDS